MRVDILFRGLLLSLNTHNNAENKPSPIPEFIPKSFRPKSMPVVTKALAMSANDFSNEATTLSSGSKSQKTKSQETSTDISSSKPKMDLFGFVKSNENLKNSQFNQF